MFELLCADCESGHHSLPGHCSCPCCQTPKRQVTLLNYRMVENAPPPPAVMEVSDWACAHY